MENNELDGFDTSQMFGGSGLHLALQRASSDKPYLGSIDVVSGLVNGFIQGVMGGVAMVGDGVQDRETAARGDVQACRDMAAIFLGKNDAYESVGQWNSGGGMVDWMYKSLDHVYQEPVANREALVADVFAFAVTFVYEAISAYAKDTDPEDSEDDGDLVEDLDNLATDLTRFLLGIPGNFPQRLFL